MRRREIIALVAGATAIAPVAARAQQPAKIPRIGWLATPSFESPEARAIRDAFWQGMRALGYVEGTNILVVYRSADWRIERFPELAAELVRLKVDLIYAGPPSAVRAAQAATSTIPIVCFSFSDPVADGFVASLARPGGNITGFSVLATELVPKCMSLLKEAVPNASRVGALWQTGVTTASRATEVIQQAEATARALGVELQLVRAQSAEGLEGAFSALMSRRAEALLVLPSALTLFEVRRIADLAARHRLPAIFSYSAFAAAGGLMAYGANFLESHRRGASYVDKILKGAKPADLPVQLPTRFEFVINLKTAKALDLTIPPLLLAQADEVIE